MQRPSVVMTDISMAPPFLGIKSILAALFFSSLELLGDASSVDDTDASR